MSESFVEVVAGDLVGQIKFDLGLRCRLWLGRWVNIWRRLRLRVDIGINRLRVIIRRLVSLLAVVRRIVSLLAVVRRLVSLLAVIRLQLRVDGVILFVVFAQDDGLSPEAVGDRAIAKFVVKEFLCGQIGVFRSQTSFLNLIRFERA